MGVILDGKHLTIKNFINVARYHENVEVSKEAIAAMDLSRAVIEEIIDSGEKVYGINTGVGKLSNRIIDRERINELQTNQVLSSCAGVGESFSEEIVRGILLLKANSFLQGHSGVRPQIVESIIQMLNKRVHPFIPQKGSVGASGDLAPLGHMSLVLIGKGKTFNEEGNIIDGKLAMEKAGIELITLTAKEGAALINGTQAMASMAAFLVNDSISLLEIADMSAALTCEALLAVQSAFDIRVHAIRNHPGQIESCKNLNKYLSGSHILANSASEKVHDAYALRCIPQVHGATRDVVKYVKTILERELNAVTDNPLVFPAEKDIISAGNFHGQPIALSMDFLSIALSELASIAERRIERLLNPNLNEGLPTYLVEEGGVNTGLMLCQYTAAALVSENKVLSHPASVDSIPTSANQEDHVSMGAHACRKAMEIINNTRYVLAIELICACQALELRKRQSSPHNRKIFNKVRRKVPFLESDRELSADIEAIFRLVKNDVFLSRLNDDDN